MKTMGIYTITNTITGDFYVGSSRDVWHRKIAHFSSLIKGTHDNNRMQKSVNKYGIESFSFEVIENIESLENIIEREQFWIDTLKPSFNIAKKADNHSLPPALNRKRTKGYKLSERTKKNMSLARKIYWSTPGIKEKRKIPQEKRKEISDGASPYIYVFVSPDGKEVTVRSVNRFSRENGLSPNWMQHVASGKRKQNAGWTLKSKQFVGYKKER